MDIEIGPKIRKVAKAKDMSSTEIAELINSSRTNVSHIYTRKSIDIEMLFKISKALEYDFFALYSERLGLQKGLEPTLTITPSTPKEVPAQLSDPQIPLKYIMLLEDTNESLKRENEALRAKIKDGQKNAAE